MTHFNRFNKLDMEVHISMISLSTLNSKPACVPVGVLRLFVEKNDETK